MDLYDVLRLMRRRWPVVLPIALLTLIVGALMIVTRADAYTVTGVQYLASVPGGSDDPNAEALDAEVVSQLMPALFGSAAVRDQLLDSGLSDDYTVSTIEASPVIRLNVTAASRQQAVETAEELVGLAPTLLGEAYNSRLAATVTVRMASPPNPNDAVANDDGTFLLTATMSVTEESVGRSNPYPPSSSTLDWLFELSGSQQLEEAVESIDGDAQFSVVQDEQRAAPIVSITATGSTTETAVEIHDLVVASLQEELARLQDEADVSLDQRTELRVLLPHSDAERTPSSVVRSLAGVVVLGGGLAVGSAVLAETLQTHRRRSAVAGKRDDHNVPVDDDPAGADRFADTDRDDDVVANGDPPNRGVGTGHSNRSSPSRSSKRRTTSRRRK